MLARTRWLLAGTMLALATTAAFRPGSVHATRAPILVLCGAGPADHDCVCPIGDDVALVDETEASQQQAAPPSTADGDAHDTDERAVRLLDSGWICWMPPSWDAAPADLSPA